MHERTLFTKFWTTESATTLKVLAKIPEGSDYRPDPKSRTAQQIAWQIICEEKMIIDALETGVVQWAPPPAPATPRAPYVAPLQRRESCHHRSRRLRSRFRRWKPGQ